MESTLPSNPIEFMTWSWPQIEPHFQALTERPLDAGNAAAWLADWSHLSGLLNETYQRLYVATTVDTTDEASEKLYNTFLDEIYPRAEAAQQVLKQKFLDAELIVEGFEIPLRNMRRESELFREANLPLLTEELKLSAEYDKIVGAQTIDWDGRELTVMQTLPFLQEPDRAVREKAWRLAAERQLADREAINDLWARFVDLRVRIANNAEQADYRQYRWKQMLRFDYTPDDCLRFHDAIEEVVVPAASQLYEKRRQRLGVDKLRPWDLEVDPSGRPALKPFTEVSQLEDGIQRIFDNLDPDLGGYFEIMRREKLLDLDNRKGKAPGGYCTEFVVSQRPFIFANSVGIHEDVQTMLHEGGHAFHVFECAHLPYFKQKDYPMEFAEVASMSMELLGAPYLSMPGGFYLPSDAARARTAFLTGSIWFWPYMAVVDAFQHWVYTHPKTAMDSAACDMHWSALWERFMPGVDWSGLEAEMITGWQLKPHIHQSPFYYIEYGLALLGAFQVWRNSLQDLPGAVTAYRQALSLGGTATLPALYQTAGARLAFDAGTLRMAVDLAMNTIQEMENIHA